MFLSASSQLLIEPKKFKIDVAGYNKNDRQNHAIDQLIVPGQPIGKIYIKIMFCWIRIFTSDNRQRAGKFKNKQDDDFYGYKNAANPKPSVNFIEDGGVAYRR